MPWTEAHPAAALININMPMILETGEGLPNSNSYADVDSASAYWLARNITRWDDASSEEQEASLIRATDLIDANYVFRSVQKSEDQALLNPRYGQDALKPMLVKATIELALLLLDIPGGQTTERVVLEEEIAVEDGVSTKFVYKDSTHDPYAFVTSILKSIASPIGGSSSGWQLEL